jgi:hypothetical protein
LGSNWLERSGRNFAASAKSPDEIVGLDFDPFLNAQDKAERYVVGNVSLKQDRYLAEVYGLWSGKKNKTPDVIPELMFQGGRWTFLNFHYVYTEEGKAPRRDDLLNLLKGLRKERKNTPGDR